MIDVPVTSLEFASSRAGAFVETPAHDRLRYQKAALWRDTSMGHFFLYMQEFGYTYAYLAAASFGEPELATHSSYFLRTWLVIPFYDRYPSYERPFIPGTNIPIGDRSWTWNGQLAYLDQFFFSDTRALFPVGRNRHYITGYLGATFNPVGGFSAALANSQAPAGPVNGGSNGVFNIWQSDYAGAPNASAEFLILAAEGVNPEVEITDPYGFIESSVLWQDNFQISAQSLPGYWLYAAEPVPGTTGNEYGPDDFIPATPLPECLLSLTANPAENTGIYSNRWPVKLWRLSLYHPDPLTDRLYDIKVRPTSPGTVVYGGRCMFLTLLAQPRFS